ncbi:Peptidoglycan/xylan/chitin deacetylase, PgdA/CDA1 family [Noviherbaspirillum humi]|uniref:Peptidoglycan/xylan/chitin deacetylase, PgdA/CDA1 family n=1 Tax=Noviherbaspirillum humi TaxID=1688639 RepID=A0A239H029_9BURK|nr:polysaccharide deacetylase family protein [Noviherbaspirillum humi]SNS74143.1 Peptidoglycan/xylan/chitin deacetylase, PgdA/CDA1 family [Noviherbaspirillum humi]
MNDSIPILLYHRIDESGLSTATPPAVFRQHLSKLRSDGWTALSLDEFAFVTTSGRPAPERSCLITFDDGYETVASAALPILEEFDFRATVFLATRFLREPGGNWGLTEDPEAAGFMTWDQARALQAGGIIDCQSHSHTHSNFTHSSLTEIRNDLGMSIDMLAGELNLPRSHFSHFAWPWGLSRPEWRSIASKCGFRFQYTVAKQSWRPDSPLDEIPRTCFDATDFAAFQRQLWLQSGQLASVWDFAYPMGRKLRQLSAGLLGR